MNRRNPSSIYNDSSKKLPGWMKRDTKYDKYGVKAKVIDDDQSQDDRYSKYQPKETSPPQDDDDRISRIRRNDTHREKRKYEQVEPEQLEQLAYTNFSVANPSSIHYESFQSNIRNRDSNDINKIVRSHYNQRTYQSKHQGSRTKSPIIKLRSFNNIIKYIMLDKYGGKVHPQERLRMLDLCCGKGGDLNKCEFIRLDEYIGIDISDGSVREAISRYEKNKVRFLRPERDPRKYNFESWFATGDVFQDTVPDILEPNFPGIIDNLFPMDMVSIQFSLHYAFETEEKIKCLINNVSKSLKVGGKFIGTMPSSEFIKDKIMQGLDDNNEFGNDLYRVKFKDTSIPGDGDFNETPYGNKYSFWLKDAVDDIPEYVVPFETFRQICEENQLIFKVKKNFIELFNQEIPNYFKKLNRNLIEGIKRTDGKYGVEGSEKEVSEFYLGFVFEKVEY